MASRRFRAATTTCHSLCLPVRAPRLQRGSCTDHSLSLSVRPRDFRLGVTIEHDAPAYIDEAFDVHVAVTNEDKVEVEVLLDILLQPGEDDSRERIMARLLEQSKPDCTLMQPTTSQSTTRPLPPSSKLFRSASSLHQLLFARFSS